MKQTRTLNLLVKVEVTNDDGDMGLETVSYEVSVGPDDGSSLWSAGGDYGNVESAFGAGLTVYLLQNKLGFHK